MINYVMRCDKCKKTLKKWDSNYPIIADRLEDYEDDYGILHLGDEQGWEVDGTEYHECETCLRKEDEKQFKKYKN